LGNIVEVSTEEERGRAQEAPPLERLVVTLWGFGLAIIEIVDSRVLEELGDITLHASCRNSGGNLDQLPGKV
jgi:hypothetical protein